MSDDERDLERSKRKPSDAAPDGKARPAGAGAVPPEHDANCLVQNRLGWSARCEISDDHVVYEQARPFSRMATRVPFESIPDDPVRELRISRSWAWATSASFGLILLCLQPLLRAAGALDPLAISLAALGFAVSGFLLRHQSGHFIVYPCEGKRIEFADHGDDPVLRAFLDQLQTRKNRYLGETYGPRNTEPESSFDPLEDPSDDPGGYRH